MREQLNLEISELQVEKRGNATLDDITQDWANKKLKEYETTIIEDYSTNSKIIKMKKSGVTGKFIIDENLNIVEMEYGGSIEFSYKIVNRNGEIIEILITITDEENGIQRIEFPNDNIINYKGEKTITEEYTVELGKEYKIKIISGNGEEKEETILIEPDIQISMPIISTDVTGTNSVDDNSQKVGTKLYINFSATLAGTDCIITPEVPYEITKNDKYKFIVTGTYNEKKVQKEIEIDVNKYEEMGGFVQYDAGEWTQEEIEELRKLSLYDLNENHLVGDGTCKLDNPTSSEAINYTFGGFSYKGSSDENIEGVVTSRNESVNPQNGHGSVSYKGWRILEFNEKDGKLYISKLIHAGSPENFTWVERGNYSGNRAVYLLTGVSSMSTHEKLNSGIKINKRNWDMYRDEKLYNDGYIKSISVMTGDELNKLDSDSDLRCIGSSYYLGNTTYHNVMNWVRYDGYYFHPNYGLESCKKGCFGIRPIVELNEGVYISGGLGTESNPYTIVIN